MTLGVGKRSMYKRYYRGNGMILLLPEYKGAEGAGVKSASKPLFVCIHTHTCKHMWKIG